ncbi:hypothetical protein SMICM304S_05066 [Streptomyces microflavus]
MATWRDLAMPSKQEVWRELRGLRTGVSGPAREVPERRAVFVAALEQAQQFTEAAETAGPATRPVQIFYALSQFGRAIAAASGLLNHDTWRLKGHGIGTRNMDASQGLELVEVVPAARGSLPTIARAIGVDPLEAQTPLTLGDLWQLIPEAQVVPLSVAQGLPAMHYSSGGIIHRGSDLWCKVSLFPFPSQVRTQADIDQNAIAAFLANYPSLKGWSHTPDSPNSVLWRDRGKWPASTGSLFAVSAHASGRSTRGGPRGTEASNAISRPERRLRLPRPRRYAWTCSPDLGVVGGAFRLVNPGPLRARLLG